MVISIVPTGDENEDYKRTDEVEELLIAQEQSHISFGKGYNVSIGGSTSPKTKEWKQRMSVYMKKRWENYPEEKKKEIIERLISLDSTEYSFSEENKANLMKYRKELWAKEEHRKRMADKMRKRISCPAEIEKKRQLFIGENNPRHHSKGPAVSPMKGKRHTEESKEKNRQAHLGKRYSPATEFKPGQNSRVFTIEDEAKICQDYLGMSSRQLAIKYKCTRSTLMKIIHKNCIPVHNNNFKHNRLW